MVAPKTSLSYMGQPVASIIPALNAHSVSRVLTHRPSRGRLVASVLDPRRGDDVNGTGGGGGLGPKQLWTLKAVL